jgi:transcriptional regulator with XRE-family HTH domain
MPTASTGKAIAMLRHKLGESQAAFAKRLETTVTTISRWENGRIGISEEFLWRLASTAEAAGLEDLQEFFTNQRKVAIVSRVESLPSRGSKRPVSLEDLKYWSAYLLDTRQSIEKILSSEIDKKDLVEILRHTAWVMEHVREQIEIPIDEKRSAKRIEEDKEILKSRGMKETNKPKGEKKR